MVDHMLRSGYSESAKQLARERGVEDLVDINVFVHCQRIAESLRRGETKDALQWCGENKAALRKSQVCILVLVYTAFTDVTLLQYNLEFELRLQQYIEMIRTGDKKKLLDAMLHAKKYLTPYMDTQATEIRRAAGLLAFPRDTKAEPYRVHTISPFVPVFSANQAIRRCTPQTAGPISRTSSFAPTTNSSPYHPDLFCTSPYPPGYQR